VLMSQRAMIGGTLGTHVAPDLARATTTAARALRDLLLDADILVPSGDQRAWAEGLGGVLAEVAIGAAWPDLKRAARRPPDDGR